MAKDPREQPQTDAERIPEQGTGKTDKDTERELMEGRVHPQGGDNPGGDQDLTKKSDHEK
jgi:hypothetical protein